MSPMLSDQPDELVATLPTPDESRAAFVAGVRAFADFLDANPDVRAPRDERFLLPLHTNPAVEDFAAEHGLTLDFDADGNASCDVAFGPIVFHAYGYVNFAEHCDRNNERNARSWAKSKGLEIVRPLVSDDTIRQAENLFALNVADREAAEAAGGAA